MIWYKKASEISSCLAVIIEDVSQEAKLVHKLLTPNVRTAAKRSLRDAHFYVDPKLAEQFRINLHLIEENDKDQDSSEERYAIDEEDDLTKKAGSKEGTGIDDIVMEDTVSFTSKKTADSNYLCSIVFQKPENDLFSVSVYMVETYLGRYAFRSNYYFRKSSRRAAEKCFRRAVRSVKELRKDVMEDDILQSRVPHLLKKRLTGIEGEIEPKINNTANYLNPNNVPTSSDPDKSNVNYIPVRRSLQEDLEQ